MLPFGRGFKMQAEWSAHSGTQLNWPTNRETWPGARMQRVEKVYAEIIKALSAHETVYLLVPDNRYSQYARKVLISENVDFANVVFHEVPINDVWVRDCGPIFIKNPANTYAITDWEYNAWGEKYPPYDDDNKLPKYFSRMYGIERFPVDMVLEGGSIDTNGNGLMMTTESVLLNPNRNPKMSKSQIEQNLHDYLGQEKIIWLKRGLAGDDTDGHIDDLCRFLDENTVMTTICEDPDDVNYAALQENLELLSKATDQNGKSLTIETLPLPKTRIEGTTVDGSEYVPASYANFYIANGIVLLPLYDERYDEQARSILQKYFPDREVVGIPCADLVWGQGSIHCITQQLYGI